MSAWLRNWFEGSSRAHEEAEDRRLEPGSSPLRCSILDPKLNVYDLA